MVVANEQHLRSAAILAAIEAAYGDAGPDYLEARRPGRAGPDAADGPSRRAPLAAGHPGRRAADRQRPS